MRVGGVLKESDGAGTALRTSFSMALHAGGTAVVASAAELASAAGDLLWWGT